MRRVATAGGELAVIDEGEGPPVLLLHGFPLSGHLWRSFVPALATRHRVIVPDLLGLGWSAKPTRDPVDIRAQAAVMRELLRTLDVERVAVVGHSTGGGVAQLLVGDPGVQTLVLIDSIAFDAWPSQATMELQVAPREQETFATIELALRSAFALGMREGALAEEDLQAYLAPWRDSEAVPAFFRWARAIDGRGLAHLGSTMGTWTVPTLLLWGEQDPFHPASIGERLQEAIPTAALGLVPGCGHFLPEEAPETIVPIVAEYLRVNYLRLPHGHTTPGPVLVPLRVPSRSDDEDDEGEDPEPIVRDDQEVGPNA